MWGNAAKRDAERLQITLIKAARIILGRGSGRKVNELHNENGMARSDRISGATFNCIIL